MTLTNHLRVVVFVAGQHYLQRITGSSQTIHLIVQRNDLVVQRCDQFLLGLYILSDELQLVHRSTLVFLGLLKHLVRVLNLLLQFLLFLLQVLHIVRSLKWTKHKAQRTKD